MEKISRIGMDTSKHVFQLHGVNERDEPVLRKRLRRGQVESFFARLAPTVIGLEACGGSHHWARVLQGLGHEAKLLPTQYVKSYVQRGKNDGVDAEATCEAMSRPRMRNRFVPVKTLEAQAAQMLVVTRDRLIRQRTQLTNAIRGHAAEFGVVEAKGLHRIAPLLARLAADETLPDLARELFAALAEEEAHLEARLEAVEAKLLTWHRGNETSQRLAKIPGVGPVGAVMLVIKAPDPATFRSGRQFAAWMGLTPKDHSTAGKTRLGVITRAGDEALRCVLVAGAMAVIQQARRRRGSHAPWLIDLLKRKEPKEAAVALANKTARIAWKLMVTGEAYDPHRPQVIRAGAA